MVVVVADARPLLLLGCENAQIVAGTKVTTIATKAFIMIRVVVKRQGDNYLRTSSASAATLLFLLLPVSVDAVAWCVVCGCIY